MTAQMVRETRPAHTTRVDEESLRRLEAGRLEEEERYCRQALARFEEAEEAACADAADMLQRLSAILAAQCQYREAESCAARAVAIMDRLTGSAQGPETELIHIEALRRLGSALRQMGRYGAAEPALQRAAMMAERHAYRAPLADVWNELGLLCRHIGRFTQGVRFHRRALNLTIDLYGEMNGGAATSYRHLGELELARRNYRIGEKLARRACEIRREVAGPDDLATVADECAMAGLLNGLRRHAESRRICERALVIFERHYGTEHAEVASTLHTLACVDVAQGKLDSALRRAARALGMRERLLGNDHADTAQTARLMTAVLRMRPPAQ
jgi:tetratricopeptide (TPR) repeat protein